MSDDISTFPTSPPAAPATPSRETAVDVLLTMVRTSLLDDQDSSPVRKAVPVTTGDRRKVRRRNVDTDVPISELVQDAVLDMLGQGDEIPVASSRQAKNRSERITLTAPAWWWKTVTVAADAVGGGLPDVVATAINRRLP